MKSLKPTCREVHQLVSERMDRTLTIVARVRVRVRAHLVLCQACTRFDDQLQLLRRALRGPR